MDKKEDILKEINDLTSGPRMSFGYDTAHLLAIIARLLLDVRDKDATE